jgi:hypothetical protein
MDILAKDDSTAQPKDLGELPSSDIKLSQRRPKADFFLSIIGIVAIVGILVPSVYDGYDNDIWFILASGREIVQNGFPYTNPWSVYSDLSIVIQQWIPDVLSYLSYTAAGWYGLTALLSVAAAVLVFCMYRLARAASPKATPEVILILMAGVLYVMNTYISYRPQIYTMIFVCLTLIVMEKYRVTSNRKLLLWLIPIAITHVNFHASMAPFDLAIVGVYWIPNLRTYWNRAKAKLAKSKYLLYPDGKPIFDENVIAAETWSLSDSDYPRLPLFISLFVMAASMLINPYGLSGALYLVHSFGAASYRNMINEMNALAPTQNGYGIALLISLACAFICIGRRGRHKIDLPLTLCVIILGFFAFTRVRNVWIVMPFIFVLVVKNLRTLPILPSNYIQLERRIKITVAICASILVLCFLISSIALKTLNEYQDSTSTPLLAIQTIDARTPEDEKSSLKVFTYFNAGGFVEWSGYHVTMDARPELWEPAITGNDTHYYQQYADALLDNDVSNLVQSSDCDYFIVDIGSDVDTYLANSDSYTVVLVGNGYRLWKKGSVSN